MRILPISKISHPILLSVFLLVPGIPAAQTETPAGNTSSTTGSTSSTTGTTTSTPETTTTESGNFGEEEVPVKKTGALEDTGPDFKTYDWRIYDTFVKGKYSTLDNSLLYNRITVNRYLTPRLALSLPLQLPMSSISVSTFQMFYLGFGANFDYLHLGDFVFFVDATAGLAMVSHRYLPGQTVPCLDGGAGMIFAGDFFFLVLKASYFVGKYNAGGTEFSLTQPLFHAGFGIQF